MARTITFLATLVACVAPTLLMASNLSADDAAKSGVTAASVGAVLAAYKIYSSRNGKGASGG